MFQNVFLTKPYSLWYFSRVFTRKNMIFNMIKYILILEKPVGCHFR